MASGAFRGGVPAGLGLAATAVVAVSPAVSFSYDASTVRAVLETTVTLVGSLAALLCLGRFRRSRATSDAAMLWAMVILAASFPLLAALPRAVAGDSGERFGMWALVGARVAAGGLLIVGSWPAAHGAWSRMSLRNGVLVISPVAVVAAAVTSLAWSAPRNHTAFATTSVNDARPLADPLVAVVELVAATLFAIASLAFSQRSRSQDDRFLGWLAAGCALLAVASINYSLSPSLELAWLHTGDLFRAGAVVAIAIGAVEEILSYWAGMASMARSQERKALARDLHDGLAQELAYLLSQTQAAESLQAPEDWRHDVQSAAERALSESRRRIRALASDTRDRFEADLDAVARDVLARTAEKVDLLTEMTSALPALTDNDLESVLRIVREAVQNALRHGRASRITITVSGRGAKSVTRSAACVLRVADNGVGFDVDEVTAQGHGYGLVSMRERANELGARFDLYSAPGRGTTLELWWP